jgi:hypothetical protein
VEWGDLTSLVEVGIGVNLGFGAIEPVRKSLTSRLENRFEVVVTQVRSLLNSRPHNKEAFKSLSDIVKRHERFSTGAERAFICVAISTSIGLLGLLRYAAGHNGECVPHLWASLVATSACVPLSVTAALVGISYYCASAKLRRIEDVARLLGTMMESVQPPPARSGNPAPSSPPLSSGPVRTPRFRN